MADFNDNQGGGTGGANQQAGEQSGGAHESHISYVKHLSHDQADPSEPGDTGGQNGQGGFISKIPGGWWTVGIGAATVIIGIIMIAKMGNGSTTSSSDPSGSSAYYPYSGSSGTADTSSTAPGALDSQLSGLLSQEQINNQVLQSILTTLTPPTTTGTTTGTGTVTSNPVSTSSNPISFIQSIFPSAKNTKGESNNFWVYTTKQGDTLASLNQFAKWGNLSSIDQKGNNVDQYRNNANILQEVGVTSVTQQIPVGTKISL